MSKIINISSPQLGEVLLVALNKVGVKILNPNIKGKELSIFIQDNNKALIVPTSNVSTLTEPITTIKDVDFITNLINSDSRPKSSVVNKSAEKEVNLSKNVLKEAIEQSSYNLHDIATMLGVNKTYLYNLSEGIIKSSKKNLKKKADTIKIVCK